MNIGMEGCMLVAACLGALVAVEASSAPLGLAAAVLAGAGCAAAIGLLTVFVPASQVVVGISFNVLALGLTGLIAREAFGTAAQPPRAPALPEAPVPLLSDIPLVGPALFDQDLVTYATYALVAVLAWWLAHSGSGTAVRAVGDSARSAVAIGLRVRPLRFAALVAGGALGGLGGGYLTIVELSFFTDNATAGRGYVAIALVVFARWRPWALAGGALLFAGLDAYQLRLQAQGGAPAYELIAALPYVAVLALLVLRPGRLAPPREARTSLARAGG